MSTQVKKPRSKSKKVVTDVIIHVKASFNNTLVTVTTIKGEKLTASSAGACGFKGSKKPTPLAAGMAMRKACEAAKDLYSIENAEIRVDGPGPGRDSAIKTARDYVIVSGIYDVTGIPFNGCRPSKERRM